MSLRQARERNVDRVLLDTLMMETSVQVHRVNDTEMANTLCCHRY